MEQLHCCRPFRSPGSYNGMDSESQSALLLGDLGGHASSQFLHFSDLWEYRWPLRRWTQLHPQGPAHPVWPFSRVRCTLQIYMLVFAGGHLGNFYNELWQFLMSSTAWQQLSSVLAPAPRPSIQQFGMRSARAWWFLVATIPCLKTLAIMTCVATHGPHWPQVPWQHMVLIGHRSRGT